MSGVIRYRKRPIDGSPVLITGGAGFVGTNLASRLLETGRPVLVFDNLSRAGAEQNLSWLRENYPGGLQFEFGDIRDQNALRRALKRAEAVFHLAAQVAVTASLNDPLYDFEVNAQGALNLLEELRRLDPPPPLIFTSTNKVYGSLEHVTLCVRNSRYEPVDSALRARGINETSPLDFCSPYGCSKGAADQYVRDYAHTFRVPAVVFRMSCIYGPHQFGTEDQGWVAHFLIRAIEGEPITICGDGRQVRDILCVDDLVDALLLAEENIASLSGQAFNIGGGPENTISLCELLDLIKQTHGARPVVRLGAWRPGDQRYYVSDTSRFQTATGWAPRISVREGVERLYRWLLQCHAAGQQLVAPTEA